MMNAALFFILSLSAPAFAQMDPTSAVLLRKGARAPEKEQLDRSRYIIRQETVEPKRPASSTNVPAKTALDSSASSVEAKPKQSKSEVAEQPMKPMPAGPVEPTAPVVATPVAEPIIVEEPPLVEQVKLMVMGGTEEAIEEYRDRLNPDDARNNLMELEIAPAYLYTESSSNYWFRSYSLSSPGFMVAAQIWLTPFFGVRSSYVNSLDASIYGKTGSDDRISVEQKWFDAGLRWRKYFGTSRRAPSFNLGVDFAENQFRVPKSSTERVSLKTVGAKLTFEATLPRSNTFAWNTGVFLIPRADHKEMVTALALRSGARDESTVLGLWIGGQHQFSRQDQLFWKLQHTFERNRFEKSASTADPVTGATPTGVEVSTGTTLFVFGFRWGH